MMKDAPFELNPYPSGAYYVDAEVVSAGTNRIEVIDIKPINYDNDEKTIKIKLVFTVSGWIEGPFSFSIYDKEDNQYYPIGDSSESQDIDLECEVFAEFFYDDDTWTMDEFSVNLDREVI
ncbi:MAG: hypothetical protein RBR41_02855 [Desulfovibrio sp.]|uniref:hypothetical protein n=1 Tax=Desulfovibrio sp. TaxID=885 RepID=UPI002A358FAE|nr:hypothetical protein [Desulfovibrio sp.]MDY0258589.1 hypothetical protein [Desulfovibrio sp.]